MDVHVCIVDLPGNVHGVSAKENESYTIYINAKDTLPKKLKTYFRGFARIKFSHFVSDKPYRVCETEANEFAWDECQKIEVVRNAPPPRICELGGCHVRKENKDLRSNVGEYGKEVPRGA